MLPRLSWLACVCHGRAMERSPALGPFLTNHPNRSLELGQYLIVDDTQSETLTIYHLQLLGVNPTSRWAPFMAVAGRVLALHHIDNDHNHTLKLQELACLNLRNAQQVSSSFRSLREVRAFARSSTGFWGIDKSILVPMLRVLSLTLDWTDGPSRPNVTSVGCALYLLTSIGRLPLLEDLTLVITHLSSSSDEWDIWFENHPTAMLQLSQLSHLRRLAVSIEVLPIIWSVASELPLLSSLIAVERAQPGQHLSVLPPTILPFMQGGFRSLESIELFCSWTRAQALFPSSMDDTFAPRLHTLVLRLPASEAASGHDFRCLLRRMRPVWDQLHHIVFDGRDQWHSRQYDKLSLDDLDGLAEFTQLRQLCLPIIETDTLDPMLHDLIDTLATSLELCTVQRPKLRVGSIEIAPNPQPVMHCMFPDPASCQIIRHTYPEIVGNHMRPMGHTSEAQQKEWFFSPPIVTASRIPVVARQALYARFPYKIYIHPFGPYSTCQFGRQVWCEEEDIDPSIRGTSTFHRLFSDIDTQYIRPHTRTIWGDLDPYSAWGTSGLGSFYD